MSSLGIHTALAMDFNTLAEVHTPKLELRSEKNQNEVREILKMGSIKAKEAAMPMIEKIRRVTGIKY